MMQVQSNFSETSLIKLKDQAWLDNQRVAGKVAAGALNLLKTEINNKTNKSLIELNKLAEDFIFSHNDCTPTFNGYKGFPAGVCISVNNQLVHGIPTEQTLQEGDLVSFDLGVTYNGAIADTAITCIYGKAKSNQHIELVSVCQGALYEAIKSIKIGKHLGCIGFAINKYVTSKSNFKVIVNYGGHGLDFNTPHAQPFVSNKSRQDDGIILQEGLTLAIEPLLAVESNKTHISSDGWTVLTEKNMSSHWEHTIYIHKDHVEIIAYRDDEQNNIPNKIYFN
jgi:methionyl aminopeptidase